MSDEEAQKHWIEYGISEKRKSSPVFDVGYYLENNEDVNNLYSEEPMGAIRHFLIDGMNEGRVATDEFNPACYRNRNADVSDALKDNWKEYYYHYINYGIPEGRCGSEIYDPEAYKINYPGLLSIYGNDYVKLYYHFIREGRAANLNASYIFALDPAVFNPTYYKASYPDLADFSDEDAIAHWLSYGLAERRKSSPVFDVNYYIEYNEDLREIYKDDPLGAVIHFITVGMSEGRIASDEFNPAYYRDNNAKLNEAYEDNWKEYYYHYINYGISEGLCASILYNPEAYRNNYYEILDQYGEDYQQIYYHYIREGKSADKNYALNPAVFNAEYYKLHYDDLKDMKDEELQDHWIRCGIWEGRIASADFDLMNYINNYEDLKIYENNHMGAIIHWIKYGISEGRIATEKSEVTAINLNKTSLTLVEGESESLQATIVPSNAVNNTVIWSSDSTSVATVDSAGKVTAVKAGTATITAKSDNGKTATCTVTVKSKGNVQKPSDSYTAHVQNIGWQSFVSDGNFAGTSGKSYRVEGIIVKLDTGSYTGGIKYRSYIQGIGWQDYMNNGSMTGTSGQSKRLEAIQIELTGDIAKYYDVYYTVHAQNYGWLGWAKNGETSGTVGYGYRLEGIMIRLVKKGDTPPSNGDKPISYEQSDRPFINYMTYVQNEGWKESVRNGEFSGSLHKAQRIESININVDSTSVAGGIKYRAMVQGATSAISFK